MTRCSLAAAVPLTLGLIFFQARVREGEGRGGEAGGGRAETEGREGEARTRKSGFSYGSQVFS